MLCVERLIHNNLTPTQHKLKGNQYLKLHKHTKNSQPSNLPDLDICTSLSHYCYPNIFRVVTPKRTFFLQANTNQVRDQWVGILQWKLVSSQ